MGPFDPNLPVKHTGGSVLTDPWAFSKATGSLGPSLSGNFLPHFLHSGTGPVARTFRWPSQFPSAPTATNVLSMFQELKSKMVSSPKTSTSQRNGVYTNCMVASGCLSETILDNIKVYKSAAGSPKSSTGCKIQEDEAKKS